jgi:1-deoxy-D-xylulose-5-phosphate synthase
MDEAELLAALRCGLALDCACGIRYPRDTVPEPTESCPPFEPGKSRRLRAGADATLLAYGVMAHNAMQAAELLAADGFEVTVVNARFAKPIDRDMVRAAFDGGRPVVTIEDHSIAGGFGSAILEEAAELGLAAHRFARLGIPADRFIEHGSRAGQLAEVGIDAAGIAAAVHRLIESQRSDSALDRGDGTSALRADRVMTR